MQCETILKLQGVSPIYHLIEVQNMPLQHTDDERALRQLERMIQTLSHVGVYMCVLSHNAVHLGL